MTVANTAPTTAEALLRQANDAILRWLIERSEHQPLSDGETAEWALIRTLFAEGQDVFQDDAQKAS